MIELEEVPDLESPVLIAAFEGWNDAADAASAVVDHLLKVWDARVVAAIDPEDFYDFQMNRPVVGMAATPTGRGYWLFATDGEYTAFASVAMGQFEAIKDHLIGLRVPVDQLAATQLALPDELDRDQRGGDALVELVELLRRDRCAGGIDSAGDARPEGGADEEGQAKHHRG